MQLSGATYAAKCWLDMRQDLGTVSRAPHAMLHDLLWNPQLITAKDESVPAVGIYQRCNAYLIRVLYVSPRYIGKGNITCFLYQANFPREYRMRYIAWATNSLLQGLFAVRQAISELHSNQMCTVTVF